MKIGKLEITFGRKPQIQAPPKEPDKKKVLVNLPTHRTSLPDEDTTPYYLTPSGKRIAKTDFPPEAVQLIRGLIKTNPDVSQTFNNVVQLSNTGYKIKFSPEVDEDLVEEMRLEIKNASLNWMDGVAGLDGIIGKFISQAYVGGAISFDTVISQRLTGPEAGIYTIYPINPEQIVFVYEDRTGRYEPYQRVRNMIMGAKVERVEGNLKKLNRNAFKYFALNGDTESPNGIPPYLASLDAIQRQAIMLDNIDFILSQVGLAGFLEATTEKPEMLEGEESRDQYEARLIAYLNAFKQRLNDGFRDGIIGGYAGDHEFNFHSTTKNLAGVSELFIQNELLVASGLKTDAALMGRGYATSETQITVVFTKALAEMKNVHKIAIPSVEFLINTHLRLKGYKYKYLSVEMNQSTITDELKFQQAREIRIRNNMNLYNYGITNLDEFADDMNLGQADQEEPRIELVNTDIQVQQGNNKEAKKDTNDKKNRSKVKPQDKKL